MKFNWGNILSTLLSSLSAPFEQEVLPSIETTVTGAVDGEIAKLPSAVQNPALLIGNTLIALAGQFADGALAQLSAAQQVATVTHAVLSHPAVTGNASITGKAS